MNMTNTIQATHRLPGHARRLTLAATLVLLVLMAVAGTARANLTFDHVGVALNEAPRIDDKGSPPDSDDFPLLKTDGTFADPVFTRQAGAHPDLVVDFKVHTSPGGPPSEGVRNVELDLPKGLVGNPAAIPTCTPIALANPGQGGANCARASQVGEAEIVSCNNAASTE